MRPFVVAFLSIAASFVVALPASASTPSQVNVVELVDLRCPYCYAVSQQVGGFADDVTIAGGIFEVAPIGPEADGAAATTVRVTYAALATLGQRVSQQIVQALMEGYQQKALLDSVAAIRSWLSLTLTDTPIHWSPITARMSGNTPDIRFYKAALLANRAHVDHVPAFVFLSGATGQVLGVVDRHPLSDDQNASSVDDVARRLMRRARAMWSKLTSTPTSISNPKDL